MATGLAVNDDFWNQFYSVNFGFLSFLSRYFSIMVSQGRVTVGASVFSYLPFVFNNFGYFKFVQIGFLILDLVLLAYLASLIINVREIFYVVLILGLIFLQNDWEHNAISAFFGFIIIPTAILLLSFIFLYISQKNNSKKLFLISLGLYAITLFTYEAYILYLPVFILIIFSYKKNILGTY